MLTSAGGEMVPFLIAALKASHQDTLRVLAVDTSEDNVSCQLADAFWLVPRGNESGYAEAVLAILRQTHVDLLVPYSDEEALSLSARKDDITESGCTLACVDHATLSIFANKLKCYAALAAAGISTPTWLKAEDPAELDNAVNEIIAQTGQCVVKPAVGRGGRNVLVIGADDADISRAGGRSDGARAGRERHFTHSAFKTLQDQQRNFAFPLLVMEGLSTPVFDIDMLAWQGRPVHIVPRRRINSELPNEGHLFVDAPELSAIGARLIQTFSLSWLYDCDVMYDHTGHPHVLEINPRPSGSAMASATAGIPLFENLIALAKGEALSPAERVAGCKVIPYKALIRV